MNTSSFDSIIVDEIRRYGLLQDRLPGDLVSLPVEWNDIKINANDFVLSDTINLSLESLYKNWLYLLSYSVIPTNDIPDIIIGDRIVTDKGNGVEWGYLNQDVPEPDSELNGVKHIIKLQNTLYPENFNMVAATTTNIILLSGVDTASIDVIINPDALGKVIRSDSNITHPSNGIFFQNIVDIGINDNKDLFVLDAHHNIVFKFDLSGITALDEAILKNDTPGRLMTGMVGGHGVLDDKIRFLSPVCLFMIHDDVFIVDQDPNSLECTVKQFDSHLNWKNSYSLGKISTQKLIDVEYNSRFDQIYILCNDESVSDQVPVLVSFDRQFNKIQSQDLMDFNKHESNIATEKYKKLYFSIENMNMMYIITDKNVYKKYVSRPTSFVGRFRFEDRSIGASTVNRDLQDLAFFPVVYNGMQKDEMLLFEKYNNTLYRFLEDSGFQNSLESQIDENIMLFEKIAVQPDDNVGVICYNKAIYKTLYNNLMLLENISRKFATFFDDKGISQYLGFRYVNSDDIERLNYNIMMDNYISSNEVVLTETVNRCLKKIFDLQQTIADNMQETSINVYPDPSRTIILS